MSEETQLRDYVESMSLKPGEGLTKAKLELARVSGGLSDVLNLEQLNLTDEDMAVIVGPISKLGHNLRVLNLFLNNFTTIPAEFGALSSLQELRMGCNPLKKIPEGLFMNMKQLQYIDIGYGEELTAMPDSIGECTALRELWAGNNRLQSLPPTLSKCSKLENLQVYGNDLKDLSDSLGTLKNLKTLNVGRNQLTTLPSTLGDCEALVELQIYENDFKSLPESLMGLKQLKILNFHGNLQMGIPPRDLNRQGLQAVVRYLCAN